MRKKKMIDGIERKGYLVVIDGTDGSGKGTQVGILMDKLKSLSIPCEMVDFPRYEDNQYGELIGEYLDGKIVEKANDLHPKYASLPYACDRLMAKPLIESWLREGKVVISNRYTSANMGHQTAKLPPDQRGEFLEWLKKLEYETNGIPKEDIVLFLFADPKIAQTKVAEKAQRSWIHDKKNDLHEGDLEHLKSASEVFLYLAGTEPNWVLIDCLRDGQLKPREEIHQSILSTLVDKGILSKNIV